MGKLKKINISTPGRKKISLIGQRDILILIVFAIGLVASLLAGFLLSGSSDFGLGSIALCITIPFVVVGVFVSLISGRYYVLLIAGIPIAIMLILKVSFSWVLAVALISIGIIGVLSLVSTIQRIIFYPIMSSVECINVDENPSLFDRLVGFMFNVSGDIDTRNLTMDYNLKRASIPWREVRSTLALGFIIGLFIWIYIGMNPSWMSHDSFSNVPVYLFAVMLYIPVLIIPFSIFMSLNVRIETRYRDFKIYDGIKGTLSRMAIPVFAAFMYILIAVNENGFNDVIYFLLLSLAFNLIINGFACIAYYKFFEPVVVDDIVSRWKEFRPVNMFLRLDTDQYTEKKDVPGTPKRDTSDVGDLIFND